MSSNGTAEKFAAATRRLEREGKVGKAELAMPSRAFTLTKGWITIYVSTRGPDGPRDFHEAKAFLADRPAARLGILIYRGCARRLHVFEYDPKRLEKLLELERKARKR